MMQHVTDSSDTPSARYRRYSKDGTYWTVRKRGRYYEVVRLQPGTYEQVDSWGAYNSAGAAAGAAAELAYQQGVEDAQEDLRAKLHGVLAGMGLGPVAVPAPEVRPEDTAKLPEPDTED